jgi:hypothetical protein
MRHLAEELSAARVLLDAARVLVNVEATRFKLLIEGHLEAEDWVPECVAMAGTLLSELEFSVRRARPVLTRVRSLDPLTTHSTLAAADRAIALLEAGHAELRAAIDCLKGAQTNLQHRSSTVFDALMARLCTT